MADVPMNIVGITVSLEIKKSTYGGQDVENRYVSLRAEVPGEVQGLDPLQALQKSLELQLTAWEAVYGAELSAGKLKSDDFSTRLDKVRARTKKIINFLTEDTTHGE